MEHKILLCFQKHRSEPMNKFWWTITQVGYSRMWLPFCALLTLLPLPMEFRIRLWCALGLQAIIVHVLLKKGLKRQRPFEACPEIVPVGKRPKDRSFPSGHTCITFTTAFLFIPQIPVLGYALLVTACLVAYSRMYLGHHYPTDVLGGFVLSIFLVFITSFI